MSCMRCDRCSGIVDTDFDLESLYVTGFDCLCEGCRDQDERYEAPRREPAGLDAFIAECIAADPRYSCKKCDWDVDGCSPCEAHAEA